MLSNNLTFSLIFIEMKLRREHKYTVFFMMKNKTKSSWILSFFFHLFNI